MRLSSGADGAIAGRVRQLGGWVKAVCRCWSLFYALPRTGIPSGNLIAIPPDGFRVIT